MMAHFFIYLYIFFWISSDCKLWSWVRLTGIMEMTLIKNSEKVFFFPMSGMIL